MTAMTNVGRPTPHPLACSGYARARAINRKEPSVGTVSIIAVPEGDTWRGRYCHWNGYPAHQYDALSTIIERDGYAHAVQVLTRTHESWSYLRPDMPSIEGVTPDLDAPLGSVARLAVDFTGQGPYATNRFTIVPGYGVAYNDRPTYYKTDRWYGPDSNVDAEWAYVLTPRQVITYEHKDRQWRIWNPEAA